MVSSTATAGGLAEVTPGDEPLPEPEESLRIADERIGDQEYNDAVPNLVDAVRADDDQLPAVEERFELIRQARTEYVEKGREVEAELRELISGDIPPDQVVPIAFQALRLIGQMTDILPNPNPEDARLITNLQSRVLLTIDRRRFNALMAAASEELQAGNYAAAVDIYVNGLGEYGFDTTTSAGTGDETVVEGQAQIAALLETDGLAIQIGGFNPNDYDLTGERFATARETIRSETVGAGDDPGFLAVAVPAEEQARAMILSFAGGDFVNARQQIDAYLPYLRDVTSIYRTVLGAADLIAAQESLNAEQALVDEEYRYNWHVRFVNDIVHGRPVAAGSDDRRAEGVLHAIASVWDIVANGPVEATQEYGAQRYEEAVVGLVGFPWSSYSTPGGDPIVSSHEQDSSSLLERVSVSYRTTMEILNVSRALGLALPPSEAVSRAADVAPLLTQLDELPEPGFRPVLLEAVARIGSAEELGEIVAQAVDAYEEGSSLASRSSVNALAAQRGRIRDQLDLLAAYAERWESFATAFDRVDAGEALLAAAPGHSGYIASSLERVRDYEVAVVRRVADIRLGELEDRLASLTATVNTATGYLNETDPVSGAPRPRTALARDALRPLVGAVSGARVLSTSSGSLQSLRNDADTLADDLNGEVDYVSPDVEIRRVVTRAGEIASTVGTDSSGLLQTARSLLERSLEQIVEAERLEEQAVTQVAEIRRTIEEAEDLNDAGNVLRASLLLDDAEDLLSSNSPEDASNLFTRSLSNWFRTAVQSRWDALREELSSRLTDARRVIVLARVEILAAEAEPLVDPPAGQEPSPGEALLLLEEAEALWATVYPLVQNPVITPLLRRARILESQQQQDLTEDIPGFDRLSQILNTARTAFDERDYRTAQRALDFFLAEQPLNAEARLLDIRLELALGEGSADLIVRNYVTRSLDEVTSGEDATNDGAAVESRILATARQLVATDGRSGTISNEIYDGLLTLRSKLSAIRQIVEQQGGVSASSLRRITTLTEAIGTILNPPEPPEPEPEDRRQIAAQIVQEQLARGNWQTLPVEQQTEIYEELVRARTLFPGTERVDELIAVIQSYLPTVRLPSTTEQEIMTSANRLVQQGNLEGALATLETYMTRSQTDPTQPDPMLIPDWRELYNDLIRRLRRR